MNKIIQTPPMPRGGKREGAGRPTADDKSRGRSATFYLAPETIEALARQAKSLDLSKSAYLTKLVDDAEKETPGD